MTLQRVAELAGVSASTVSRVINSAPGIAAETAENVRRAMAQLEFSPTPRRRSVGRPSNALKGAKVGFVVLGASGAQAVTIYDQLMRGVAQGCEQYQMDMRVCFAEDSDEAVDRIASHRVDGLVMHGYCAMVERSQELRSTPTVWLMGNRRRPTWGDQVMPDNVTIGQLAAQYLLRQGHRNVAYFGPGDAWWLATRCLGFQQCIEDAGGEIQIVPKASATHGTDGFNQWHANGITDEIESLAKILQQASPRPTGLFVAEDWLINAVYHRLASMGIKVGVGSDLDIITCNNQTSKLIGIHPVPANIDIRIETIGFRGVEHLAWRLLRRDSQDRLRLMVEPILVPPPGYVAI